MMGTEDSSRFFPAIEFSDDFSEDKKMQAAQDIQDKYEAVWNPNTNEPEVIKKK